jgi:hypothetical protein
MPSAWGWHLGGRGRSARRVAALQSDAGNYLELARLIDGCRSSECIAMGSGEGAVPGSVSSEPYANATTATFYSGPFYSVRRQPRGLLIFGWNGHLARIRGYFQGSNPKKHPALAFDSPWVSVDAQVAPA